MQTLPQLALVLLAAVGSVAPSSAGLPVRGDRAEVAHRTETLTGFWSGAAVFKGDAWPVELDVEVLDTESASDSVTVLLGLPELGMAREPIPAHLDGDGLRIELPFGLGQIGLQISEDLLSGTPRLGSGTLALHLERSRAPELRREAIRFHNGPATLVGELVLPPGQGPHPAVVLLHGSAPQGLASWPYRSWAEYFARRGIAALAYDKRGVGESTGPWMTVSFPGLEDLAADAAAAVELLAARPEIDRGRIGLAGGSQAAWVALQATERTEAVSFLILRSAPAGTPAEQELQAVETRVRSAHGNLAASRAIAHTRLLFSVAATGATGAPWQALRESVAAVETEPWADLVQRPRTPDDLFWWRNNFAIDARLLALGLADRIQREGPGGYPSRNLPSLLLYGAVDSSVPPDLNAPILGALLPNTTVHVFPAADHGLEVAGGTGLDGRWRFPRKAPGLFEAIDAWLEEQGLLPTTPDETGPEDG